MKNFAMSRNKTVDIFSALALALSGVAVSIFIPITITIVS